jgi:putative endonuclease
MNDKPDPRHALGSEAERVAAEYLKRKGYQILEMNFRTRRGEIDIVCNDNGCLVFVEVKSASKPTDINPGESIHYRKQQRLQLAATEYISTHEIPGGGVRFDAIVMIATERGEWKIDHAVDAFRGSTLD